MNKAFNKLSKREQFIVIALNSEGHITNHHNNNYYLQFQKQFYKAGLGDAKVMASMRYFINKVRDKGYCGKCTTLGTGHGGMNCYGARTTSMWFKIDCELLYKDVPTEDCHRVGLIL